MTKTTKSIVLVQVYRCTYLLLCRCVETLLTHKANISAVQKDGLTPIHIAAEKGFTEIVNILLQKKSDLINDRAGKVRNHTPLYFATTSNQSGMVKFLLQRYVTVCLHS